MLNETYVEDTIKEWVKEHSVPFNKPIPESTVKCFTQTGSIETFDELMFKEGKINPVGGLFLMKNNYGYTDKTEVKISDDEISTEEIERRYHEQHEIVEDSNDD